MNAVEKAFVRAGFKLPSPKKPRPQKIQKCRKCGAPMQIIEGTNVMVCTGDIEVKTEEGDTRLVACMNRVIFTHS